MFDLLARAVVHSSVQFVGGFAVAALVDLAMPDPTGKAPSTFGEMAMLAVEGIFQITALSIISAGVISFMAGLVGGASDPTNGVAFFMAILTSSPMFHLRMSKVYDYIKDQAATWKGGISAGEVEPTHKLPIQKSGNSGVHRMAKTNMVESS